MFGLICYGSNEKWLSLHLSSPPAFPLHTMHPALYGSQKQMFSLESWVWLLCLECSFLCFCSFQGAASNPHLLPHMLRESWLRTPSGFHLGIVYSSTVWCSCRSVWFPVYLLSCPLGIRGGRQIGGVEGHAFISPARAAKSQLAVEQLLTGRQWDSHTHTKRYHTFKTKEKLQQNSRRGTIMIKSNPLLDRWVTHKLENNYTKVALTLLWSF